MLVALGRLLLALNVLWFGAGFVFFALRPARAAKILVPREARTEPLFRTIVAALPFLGGMNLALAVLAGLLLLVGDGFVDPRHAALYFAVFGLAHATQFAFNLPVLLAGRRGAGLWPVTRGPMRFIFVTDGGLALANVALAGWLALSGARAVVSA